MVQTPAPFRDELEDILSPGYVWALYLQDSVVGGLDKTGIWEYTGGVFIESHLKNAQIL